jgi:metal-responsive CopG/Arc/MetJ family transcriptional regulator
MDKMHRAQILLEPDQHRQIAEIAEHENTSISELVRQAVHQFLSERNEREALNRQLSALHEIAQHHQAILSRRGGSPLDFNSTDLVERIRNERDQEIYHSSIE